MSDKKMIQEFKELNQPPRNSCHPELFKIQIPMVNLAKDRWETKDKPKPQIKKLEDMTNEEVRKIKIDIIRKRMILRHKYATMKAYQDELKRISYERNLLQKDIIMLEKQITPVIICKPKNVKKKTSIKRASSMGMIDQIITYGGAEKLTKILEQYIKGENHDRI